jgi:hypothetical protein
MEKVKEPIVINSFDDFIAFIESLKIDICKGDPAERYDYGGYRHKEPSKDKRPFIFVEYSVGGIRGGSCWDDSEVKHYAYTSSDQPEELAALDTILEKITPNITFLQYKNIVAKVIKHDTRTENEYYGNSTNYAIKKCNLETLYNVLKEKEII